MPHVVSDGISIHYRVEGSGPPLVLQHGFADSSESVYEFGYVDALKSRFQLILPDTRGHGRSDKPHEPEAYTPQKYATDITAVLDDVGVRNCRYWGYSQGGWIGFALAQYAPDRFTHFVIGGAASAGSAFRAGPGQEDPLIAALLQGADALPRIFGQWVTPSLADRLRQNDAAALLACRRQRLVTAGYADIEKISVPTLLYAGTADLIYDAAQQSASRIPGAEFVSLPDLNHSAAFCQPNDILPRAQDFLGAAGGRR